MTIRFHLSKLIFTMKFARTLAEKIGVQAQVISAMENGRRPVSRNMAAKFGKFFKCSPKTFFAFPDNL